MVSDSRVQMQRETQGCRNGGQGPQGDGKERAQGEEILVREAREERKEAEPVLEKAGQ